MVDLSHFTLLTIISALPSPGVLRVEIFQKLLYYHVNGGLVARGDTIVDGLPTTFENL